MFNASLFLIHGVKHFLDILSGLVILLIAVHVVRSGSSADVICGPWWEAATPSLCENIQTAGPDRVPESPASRSPSFSHSQD